LPAVTTFIIVCTWLYLRLIIFKILPETLLPVSFMCVCVCVLMGAYSQATVNKRTSTMFMWCVPVKLFRGIYV